MKDKIMLFAISHQRLLNFLAVLVGLGLNFVFLKNADAATYGQFNTNAGSVGTTGASGILDTATTWICYRLAPATTALGVAKGFYDIKRHKPQAAEKAFITGSAGVGVMITPTIINAIVGLVTSVNPPVGG